MSDEKPPMPARSSESLSENELADEINAEYEFIVALDRVSLEAKAAFGARLIVAKRRFGQHGKWLPWLSTHTSKISESTAQRYMLVARNPAHVRDFASLRSALESIKIDRVAAKHEAKVEEDEPGAEPEVPEVVTQEPKPEVSEVMTPEPEVPEPEVPEPEVSKPEMPESEPEVPEVVTPEPEVPEPEVPEPEVSRPEMPEPEPEVSDVESPGPEPEASDVVTPEPEPEPQMPEPEPGPASRPEFRDAEDVPLPPPPARSRGPVNYEQLSKIFLRCLDEDEGARTNHLAIFVRKMKAVGIGMHDIKLVAAKPSPEDHRDGWTAYMDLTKSYDERENRQFERRKKARDLTQAQLDKLDDELRREANRARRGEPVSSAAIEKSRRRIAAIRQDLKYVY